MKNENPNHHKQHKNSNRISTRQKSSFSFKKHETFWHKNRMRSRNLRKLHDSSKRETCSVLQNSCSNRKRPDCNDFRIFQADRNLFKHHKRFFKSRNQNVRLLQCRENFCSVFYHHFREKTCKTIHLWTHKKSKSMLHGHKNTRRRNNLRLWFKS